MPGMGGMPDMSSLMNMMGGDVDGGGGGGGGMPSECERGAALRRS